MTKIDLTNLQIMELSLVGFLIIDSVKYYKISRYDSLESAISNSLPDDVIAVNHSKAFILNNNQNINAHVS